MALTDESVQAYLETDKDAGEVFSGDFTSDSGNVGRASIDGTLVIYDLDDRPAWLNAVLAARDEDGNVERIVA